MPSSSQSLAITSRTTSSPSTIPFPLTFNLSIFLLSSSSQISLQLVPPCSLILSLSFPTIPSSPSLSTTSLFFFCFLYSSQIFLPHSYVMPSPCRQSSTFYKLPTSSDHHPPDYHPSLTTIPLTFLFSFIHHIPYCQSSNT